MEELPQFKFCRRCHQSTPHEVVKQDGVSVEVCSICWVKARQYNLDFHGHDPDSETPKGYLKA